MPKAIADRYIEKLTPQLVAAMGKAFGKRVRQYHRLFMLPAVSHCGGGTGPSAIGGGAPEPTAALRDPEHHVVSAMIRWVEEGEAPEKIAELPDEGCTAGSPFGRQMETAKRTFIRFMQRHVQRIRLTGLIFFDKLHGQAGVAPNRIELHPILMEALP
jgi:hypothetical protein